MRFKIYHNENPEFQIPIMDFHYANLVSSIFPWSKVSMLTSTDSVFPWSGLPDWGIDSWKRLPIHRHSSLLLWAGIPFGSTTDPFSPWCPERFHLDSLFHRLQLAGKSGNITNINPKGYSWLILISNVWMANEYYWDECLDWFSKNNCRPSADVKSHSLLHPSERQ